MVGKCFNFNLKKGAMVVAPLFYSGVDFGVFDAKIWVLKTRVVVLRLLSP
jgi:hypothetical protein